MTFAALIHITREIFSRCGQWHDSMNLEIVQCLQAFTFDANCWDPISDLEALFEIPIFI